MPSPFPGMDPYLERPSLWPDVHNALIAAVRDEIAPVVRPRYFVAIEERIFHDVGPELALVGRADVAIVSSPDRGADAEARSAPAGKPTATVLDVEVPVPDTVRETFLEIRSLDGDVVTVIEVLSPTNKRPGEGRRVYLEKRASILATSTSLVEIDLLRQGERMPLHRGRVPSDYATLVCRSWERPGARLFTFGIRDPVPSAPVPLRRGEEDVVLDLGAALHGVYDRAGYDLRLDYGQPVQPPLSAEDEAWVDGRLRALGRRG